MDDIVTRLRNHVRGDYEKTSDFMLGLAADEIERLRADRDRWKESAMHIWEVTRYDADVSCRLCLPIVEEAVRGD